MRRENPPRWAETFLRATLKPRDRDTVSGDLLEEFRETAVPQKGIFGARLWYLRQVASLTDVPAIGRIASPLHWVMIIAAVQFVFLFLVPRAFGVMLELSLFVPVAVALAVMGIAAIHSRQQVLFLLRVSAVWGIIFAAVMLSKMFFDALRPAELWAAVAVTFFAPAMLAAWKTGQFRAGILAVMGASFFGSILVVAAVFGLAQLGIAGNHPPIDLNFVLLATASGVIVGTMGAMLAKGIGTLLHRPVCE